MSIPDELWINGRAYDVEMRSGNPFRETEMGLIEFIRGVISINEDLDLGQQLKSLIHEAFHAWDQDINGEMDEKRAHQVAVFCHNLFLYNRELADCYCTHGEKEDDD